MSVKKRLKEGIDSIRPTKAKYVVREVTDDRMGHFPVIVRYPDAKALYSLIEATERWFDIDAYNANPCKCSDELKDAIRVVTD